MSERTRNTSAPELRVFGKIGDRTFLSRDTIVGDMLRGAPSVRRLTRETSTDKKKEKARKLRLPKAVILDGDGVLFSTPHLEAWTEIIQQKLGMQLTQEDYDHLISGKLPLEGLAQYVEAKQALIADPQLQQALANPEAKAALIKDIADTKQTRVKELIHEKTGEELVFQDGRDFVLALHQQGVKIGMASASRSAMEVLTKIGLEPYVDVVVYSQQVHQKKRGGKITEKTRTIASKPDPMSFDLARRTLGVRKSRAIGIGDAPVDTEAAHRAGMVSIGLNRTHIEPELRAAGGDTVITTFNEILPLTRFSDMWQQYRRRNFLRR